MVISRLKRGDFIAARALIPFEILQNMKIRISKLLKNSQQDLRINKHLKQLDEMSEQNLMQSTVNIVADSKVQAWILSKNDMSFMPDQVLKDIFQMIVQLREVDRPLDKTDEAYLVRQFKKWDAFKEHYSMGVIDSKKERKRLR